MKSIVNATIAMLTLCAAPVFSEDAKGTVILANGTTYEAMRISGCFVSDGFLKYKPIGSAEVTIPVSAISSIYFNKVKRSGGGQYVPQEAMIFFKNGNSVSTERIWYTSDRGSSGCSLKVKDKVSGLVVDVKASFKSGDSEDRVVEVRLDSVGEFNWSASSQTAFPRSFLFDPFTGEELTPITTK